MSVSVDGVCPVYNETTPKARRRKNGREWQCCACHDTIPRGHRYSRTATLYDGSWTTYIRCLRCQRIHEHLRDKMAGSWDEWPDEDLNCGHEYSDRWDVEPPPEIAALAFMTAQEAQATL